MEAINRKARRGSSGWSLRSGGNAATGADCAPHDDVAEALVEVRQLRLARRHLHPQHQEIAHPAARVVVAIEARTSALASSMVLVTLKSATSSGETQPAPMASSSKKRSQACQ